LFRIEIKAGTGSGSSLKPTRTQKNRNTQETVMVIFFEQLRKIFGQVKAQQSCLKLSILTGQGLEQRLVVVLFILNKKTYQKNIL
jgi:hypothetical protein